MGETEGGQFGRLLREHRVAAGLSQEGLAERARLSRRTITNLERGTTAAPYVETVALLADALELTESERAELERAVDRSRTPATGAGAEGGGLPPVTAGEDALLATKLAIPPARPALIPRPRLVERLRRGLRGPLTLLSAPPGSGKTTLLSAWRATPEGRRRGWHGFRSTRATTLRAGSGATCSLPWITPHRVLALLQRQRCGQPTHRPWTRR